MAGLPLRGACVILCYVVMPYDRLREPDVPSLRQMSYRLVNPKNPGLFQNFPRTCSRKSMTSYSETVLGKLMYIWIDDINNFVHTKIDFLNDQS